MNAKIEQLLDECCENPKDTLTWGEWLEAFKACGVTLMDDDSGFAETKMLTASEARVAITRCTCQYDLSVEEQPEVAKIEVATVEVVSPELSIAEWRTKYTQICQRPPIGEVLQTIDGSQVRLEIELFPSRPPLVYTRAFVPNIVCGQVGWFAQGIEDRTGFGWKLILLPKARDEAIKRFGLEKNVAGVKAVRVIKASNSNLSLLGEIAEW